MTGKAVVKYEDNDNAAQLLPFNTEYEKTFIGSILQYGNREKVEEFIGRVKVETFYYEPNRVVWNSILRVYRQKLPIELVTVWSDLEKHGELDNLPTPDYLMELSEHAPFPSNVAYYENQVQGYAMLRKIIVWADSLMREANLPETKPYELINSILSKGLDFAKAAQSQSKHISDDIDKALEDVRLAIMDDPMSGIPMFHGVLLDKLMGRLRPGQLIIIAGPTKGGKSAWLQDQILRWAEHGVHVMLGSAEMYGREIALRFISNLLHRKFETDLPYQDMDAGRPNARKLWAKIEEASNYLRKLPIYTIDDEHGEAISVDLLRREFLKVKAQAPNARWVACVDYTQILKTKDDRSTREEQIAKIGYELKHLSSRIGAPILAVSQVNDDWRRDKGPRSNNLRESKKLAMAAHKVAIIYQTKEQRNTDAVYFHLDLNRNGRVGKTKLIFRKPFSVFFTEEEAKEHPYRVIANPDDPEIEDDSEEDRANGRRKKSRVPEKSGADDKVPF